MAVQSMTQLTRQLKIIAEQGEAGLGRAELTAFDSHARAIA